MFRWEPGRINFWAFTGYHTPVPGENPAFGLPTPIFAWNFTNSSAVFGPYDEMVSR